MSTVPAVDGPSDAELIDSVRGGTVSAYGSLYERHVAAAYNLARQLTRSPAEADDLVSEAFAKVLATLRDGRGPDSAFRAYLLTALRHTAYDKTRRDRRVELSDDVSQVSGVDQAAVSVPFTDTAVAGLDRSLAARAFAKLPERWQAVLWHTEIEGQSPAEVAPLLGLTPNGVSALAYRAREGLRQAYLQVHLAETDEQTCRAAAERLGAWVRGGLSKRETAQVESHLDTCAKCKALAAELADVNGTLRGLVAPLVLGAASAGYLAAAKLAVGATAIVGTAGAVGTVGAAGAAGGSGGAAGAIAGAPRQFLGAAASGVALAAAIAVGVAASPSEQQIPVAAPVQTTAPAPQPPAPQPPAPQPPAPRPPQPQPPAQPRPPTPAPTPPPTQADPPAPAPVQPPPTPDPEPIPGPPDLAADPVAPVSVEVGEGPAELPITVRNTGGSVSEPVVATLALPPGVRAVEAERLSSGPRLLLNAAQTGTVACPAGRGTVTCSSGTGLRPGDSVTLMFLLVADPGSIGGRVTGTVTAGARVTVDITVTVNVKEKRDGVDVRAWAEGHGWFDTLWPWDRQIRLQATAKNTGETTKLITLTVDEPTKPIPGSSHFSCSSDGNARTTCQTREPVAPGTEVSVAFQIVRGNDRPHDGKWRKISVTAVLGTAVDTAQVTVPWHGPWWPDTPGQDRPTPTTTVPSPTTTAPTSAPPSTTTPAAPTTATTTPPGPPTTTTTTQAKPKPSTPAPPTPSVAPPSKPTAPPTTKGKKPKSPHCHGPLPKWLRWDLPC